MRRRRAAARRRGAAVAAAAAACAALHAAAAVPCAAATGCTVGSAGAAALAGEVREMFTHAYDGYMQHAFPRDELRPLRRDGIDSLQELGNLDGTGLTAGYSGVALTLVESLTTHAVMGNTTEFRKGVGWLADRPGLFDQDVRVNVFETTIRLLGPLVSAHMLATYVMPELTEGYNTTAGGSPLLALAADLGARLLPAFTASPSGIPFAWVNLQTGVRENETAETNLAGAGTNILEYGMLSRLTGDPAYEDAAVACLAQLWKMRSRHGLFGTSLDVRKGAWADTVSGIGFGGDSYYEYLLKAYLLFGDPWYFGMFASAYEGIQRHMRSGPWYADVNMVTGMKTQECFTSLQAFFPGLQAEVGDLEAANATHRAFYSVWERYGLLPERWLYPTQQVHPTMKYYPLRPELAESTFLLHQATLDPYYQCEVGRQLVSGLNSHARVASGGFAAVRDVETKEKEDLQHSFFLSETLKYLYLLYNASFLDAGPFVFTTEGHPLPVLGEFRGRRLHTRNALPHRLRGAHCWRSHTHTPRQALGQGCSALDLRVCPWQHGRVEAPVDSEPADDDEETDGAGSGQAVDSACHVPDRLPRCTTHDDCGVDASTCRERLCSQSNWCYTP